MSGQNVPIPVIHPAPPEIVALVDRFDRQRSAYRSGKYNETQLRRDFLDPLFEALGWDMTNRKDYSEKYREVIHEVSVEVEGQAKAADYAFQSGGHIHFFLEAKKPSVNIETNPEPAFQIRRYAWSAKVPVSILSDFEQLAVYDCRAKPVHGDPVHLGRVKLYSFSEYVDKWDELYRLFSYQAVHQGSLDQFAVGLKGKRGTADVDDAFLVEMERWREELARNIALRNPSLNQREVNSTVQTTIDRIIFLRICEERGIEAEDALREATDGKEIYSDLLVLFNQADKKYNSGLFHFSTEKGQSSYPDTLTPTLKIDDKVLKDILANLYYPKSPYAFKYISADILGQVYERFLGKVIRLTAGHQAKVEEKPEVRKAGGVYYTPTYIVDYIVKNTLGELIKDKTPESLKNTPLRVLDPACGSGSFLLGAYQYLLDWYLDWYVQHDPAKWGKGKTPPIFESRSGWQLTMQKKKSILTSHIFGVDIDAQAVEVTKLSLLLKVVENPGQLSLLGERILPDLGENIKCGNSLIGPDYYDDQQPDFFDPEEQYRVNAFDWQVAFPQVFKAGGFDAVIGNPPYLGGREWKEDGGNKYNYFVKKYNVAEYQFDIYALFWEQGIILLKNGGLIGFITPNTWLNNQSSKKLRNYILERTAIKNITDYSKVQVFDGVVVLPIITILARETGLENQVLIYRAYEGSLKFLSSIPQQYWMSDSNKIINLDLGKGELEIRTKIESNKEPLESIAEVKFGIKLYETGKGIPPQQASFAKDHIYEADYQKDANYRHYLEGKDVFRFQIKFQNRWLLYGSNLAAPRNPSLFEGDRLLIRRIVGERLIGTFTDENFVTSQLLQIVKPRNPQLAKYILGLLNSSLMAFYFKKKYNRQDKTFPEIRIYELASLPIRTIDFSAPTDVTHHDRMVSLVETMLTLHKQVAAARLPDEKEHIQRQIQMTDRQIDKLVYTLYGLSDEEIKIIEGS